MKRILIKIAIIVGMALIIFFLFKAWRYQKSKSERWEKNFKEMNEQFTVLKMSSMEFRENMDLRIDSLLKIAKVKSKNVTEVNNIHHYYYDSTIVVIRPEPVVVRNDTIYPFLDTKDCFEVGGQMQIVNNRPELLITHREYTNEITEIHFRKWGERKILRFIPWGWGYNQEVFSDCGETTTDRIVVETRRQRRRNRN